MNFGQALEECKLGSLIARSGWNGKNMYVYYVPGSIFVVNRAPLNTILPAGTEINYLPHLDMHTATGDNVPWLASQTDVLAEDWDVVNL